jgi:hypothetical protein
MGITVIPVFVFKSVFLTYNIFDLGNEEADRFAGEATAGRGRARSLSVDQRRQRLRSVSRNGRGAPNSTVFVQPKRVSFLEFLVE